MNIKLDAKKYLLFIPLVILIQGCVTNGIADHRTPLSSAREPNSYNKYIGELTVGEVAPILRDVQDSELKDRATEICSPLGGVKYAPSLSFDGLLGYKRYSYECNGPQPVGRNPAPLSNLPQTNNSLPKQIISIDKAKQQCKDLGFKAATEKFGNCVLELTR